MTPLYLPDAELRSLVAPHVGVERFRALAQEMEQHGFPRVDPLFRGRYVPAVRAWLDARAGLRPAGGSSAPDALTAPDGEEHWKTQTHGRTK